MSRRSWLGIAFTTLSLSVAGCAAEENLHTGARSLTEEQCSYFAENDKVTICHRTSSVKNPYTIIRTSTAACADGHADHAEDYVASSDPSSPLYDPTCAGLGYLPEGAPVDATVDCCEGFAAVDGYCRDVDECAAGTDNCSANATCTNTPGSFTCACNSGYSGDGVTCTDVDECTAGTSNCSANATCTNTPGSFTCACKPGYSGNGVTCANIDECASNPCQNGGTCTDGINDYTCACVGGYGGKSCATPPVFLHYSFDGNFLDSSGNANHGILQDEGDTSFVTSPAAFGQAWNDPQQTDGNDRVAFTTPFNPGAAQAWTFAFWHDMEGGVSMPLFSGGQSSSTGSWFRVRADSVNGAELRIAGQTILKWDTNLTLAQNGLFHYAIVANPAGIPGVDVDGVPGNDHVALYVNGALITPDAGANLTTYGTSVYADNVGDGSSTDSGPSLQFETGHGVTDELWIFNGALTGTQVNELRTTNAVVGN